ncbi:MAG: hypothetical protein HC802_08180 [Caldilineaceae bacterium]|nr:hypothetical protein [Caldilineaceae bacterium]
MTTNRATLLIISLSIFLLAACNTLMPPPTRGKRAAVDAPFTLAAGESIALAGEPLTFVLEKLGG